MATDSRRVAIVIPSYNERENLSNLIPAIAAELPQAAIVVVDDHSPDGTGQAVKQLQGDFKQLYLIERKGKEGRGSAVIAGFKYAYELLAADVYLEMDADFSHNPQELPEIVNNVDPKTAVIASRYMKGGAWVDCPPQRVLTSTLGNFMIRTVLGLPFKDNTNGLRAYPKEAIAVLLKHDFVSNSYIVLSETAKVLLLSGFNVKEVPSIFINRTLGNSNTTIREFSNSLNALFKMKRHLNIRYHSHEETR